jgi:hypothetical protein
LNFRNCYIPISKFFDKFANRFISGHQFRHTIVSNRELNHAVILHLVDLLHYSANALKKASAGSL